MNVCDLTKTGASWPASFPIVASGAIAARHCNGSLDQGNNDMGSFSVWHWVIVLAVVLLLFGRGKIPELMGDVAKGIRSFKNGLSDETAAPAEKRIETGSGE